MTDIILHHYYGSPFAEKIHVLLGLQQLRWRSVLIPKVMPKPDLLALTGGYRKTPVLQIGADIYCDTALISRVLDERSERPSLYPPESLLSAQAIASWADNILFPITVALVFQPEIISQRFSSAAETEAFVKDRIALRKNGNQRQISVAEAHTVLDNYLRDYNQQLSDGRKYLLGNSPTIADVAVYHPLWFVRGAAVVSEKLKPYQHVLNWMDRLADAGHGESEELSSAEALEIAKRSHMAPLQSASDIAGIAVGDHVEVTPADYGMDPVSGILLLADHNEIVVARSDEAVGEVAVHFPRFCYTVRKQ